jgi:hypothetical protein
VDDQEATSRPDEMSEVSDQKYDPDDSAQHREKVPRDPSTEQIDRLTSSRK